MTDTRTPDQGVRRGEAAQHRLAQAQGDAYVTAVDTTWPRPRHDEENGKRYAEPVEVEFTGVEVKAGQD